CRLRIVDLTARFDSGTMHLSMSVRGTGRDCNMPTKKNGQHSKKRGSAGSSGKARRKPVSPRPDKLKSDFETVKAERDAFARYILEQLMPEFGPINFTKAQVLKEAKRNPTPEQLIARLSAEK